MPKSEYLTPRSSPKLHERAILGVVDGGGRVVQGLSGAASMAAEDLAERAKKWENTPDAQRPQYISDSHKNEPWYKQVYHNIVDTFTATPQQQAERANDFTGRRASENKGAIQDVKNYADKIHNDAKDARQKLQPHLGTAGGATSFATQLIPGVRAMDTVVSTGENKNLKDGAITAIANRVIPGSAAASQGVSAAATAAKDLAFKVTQQAVPEAVKGLVSPSSSKDEEKKKTATSGFLQPRSSPL